MPAALYLKVLGATCLVLGLFLVTFYLLRRGKFKWTSGAGEIEVREIRALGLKHRLALVKVRNCILLLGLSEKGIHLLKEWPDEVS